jgi:hypothetical protein
VTSCEQRLSWEQHPKKLLHVGGILRHSIWDAVPIILSLAHGAALIAAPSRALVALGLWWNANTIAHNFIHLPFFRSAVGNRIYSCYLTLVLGFPQSLWRERHLAHHAGVPNRIRPTTSMVCEAFLVVALWGVLLLREPYFFWTLYVPGYVVGLGLCFLQGYFEHAGGTVSHHGLLYNVLFLNDGYHEAHHMRPSEHWTRLPHHTVQNERISRWPAVLRWMDIISLEGLERIALRSPALQRLLLRTHERALRKHLAVFRSVRTVHIVGGGMFPRTALLLQRLLPEAEITIVDASLHNLETARRFLDGRILFAHRLFKTGAHAEADLVVIPLCFIGDRQALYRNPPAPLVLIHDWLWSRGGDSVIVSAWLLKRLNLVRHT